MIILILRFIFWRANRRRDRAVAEGRLKYDKEALDKEDLSDWKNPSFRYVLVSSLRE